MHNKHSIQDDFLKKFIGEKIRENRVKKKLTQLKLAEKLGVDNSTVSAYERGVINTDLNTLFALSDIFEIRIDDFFPRRSDDKTSTLHEMLVTDSSGLELEDVLFIKNVMDSLKILNPDQRTSLKSNIDLAIDFFKNREK